jgi:hypothetical protein
MSCIFVSPASAGRPVDKWLVGGRYATIQGSKNDATDFLGLVSESHDASNTKHMSNLGSGVCDIAAEILG